MTDKIELQKFTEAMETVAGLCARCAPRPLTVVGSHDNREGEALTYVLNNVPELLAEVKRGADTITRQWDTITEQAMMIAALKRRADDMAKSEGLR